MVKSKTPPPRSPDGNDLPRDKRLALLELQDEYRAQLGELAIAGVFYHYCKGCSEILPVSMFDKHPRMRLGLINYCNSCLKKRRQQYEPAQDGTRTCRSCKVTKPEDEFAIRRQQPGGRSRRCKPCESLVQNKANELKRLKGIDTHIQTFRRRRTVELSTALGLEVKEGEDIKWCSGCRSVKSVKEFTWDTYAADKLNCFCSTCVSKQNHR